MYSQADIEDAIAAGALAPDQAANLRDFVATRNRAPTADEEYARIFLGFNDLFVTYACFFVLVALGAIGAQVDGPPGPGGVPSLKFLLGGLLVTAGAWGLSELFLHRQRFALPGILLVLAFGLGTLITWIGLVFLILADRTPDQTGAGLLITLGIALASFLCWLHWRRFRVPFANLMWVGLAVGTIIALIGTLTAQSGAIGSIMPILVLICGLGTFAYAMTWDARDPYRVTARSEVGMWLHWLAAGLIMWGIMGLIGGRGPVVSPIVAIVMIVIFILFLIVSIIVNRRQLLLAGLTPLVAALGSLLGAVGRPRFEDDDFGDITSASYNPGGYGSGFGSHPRYGGGYGGHHGDIPIGMLITFVIVAAILLLLALYWNPIRRGLLHIVPSGLRRHLSPPAGAVANAAPVSSPEPPLPPEMD